MYAHKFESLGPNVLVIRIRLNTWTFVDCQSARIWLLPPAYVPQDRGTLRPG